MKWVQARGGAPMGVGAGRQSGPIEFRRRKQENILAVL